MLQFNFILFHFSAHHFPEVDEGLKSAPLPYQFYSGIELHPRLLGVDIKQLTNCRFGMLGWALLVLNFAIASIQRNGFNFGPLANAVLINLYLLKFFYWETGYFNTLDITLDRAGYYLCWGCLTWVQVFYTFSAYYLVSRPSLVTSAASGVILVLGLASLGLNYWADYQKEKFKVGHGGFKEEEMFCFILSFPTEIATSGAKRQSLFPWNTQPATGKRRKVNY